MSLEQRIADIIARDSIERTSPISGSRLHKVPPDLALVLANAILGNAKEHTVPLYFLMAVIRQESAFDPMAVNPNLDRFPEERLATSDIGLAQVSGANLLDMFPMKTKEEILAIAHDPEWAVPFIAKHYRALLDWAKEKFPHSDPFYVAAMAYNTGRTGATLIIQRRPDPKVRGYETLAKVLVKELRGRKHARTVMRLRNGYAKELSEGVV